MNSAKALQKELGKYKIQVKELCKNGNRFKLLK